MEKNTGFVLVEIDDITPCLKDMSTGELVDTEVIRLRRSSFLQKYNKKNGWYVNWGALVKESEIYALVIKGTMDIQGLVALQNDVDAKAAYIQWAVAAPQNNKQLTESPKYSGIGGHLFAVAGRKSYEWGYNGDIYGFAANEKLLKHYVERLGAEHIGMLHTNHFAIWGAAIEEIVKEYTYDWTDEEI